MKKIVIMLVGLALLSSAATVMAEDQSANSPTDTGTVVPAESKQKQASDQIVVYYLHMNRRCMTCGKLETYSREAVDSGFSEQLKDSSIVFRVENFEQEGNEHFVKHYQLYSQSLILSRQRDGEETEWKNLDKIWSLVGDKEAFVTYVQTEVAEFMHPKEKK